MHYNVYISAFISLDMRSDTETNQFDCDILKYAYVAMVMSIDARPIYQCENFNYIIQMRLYCLDA